VSTLGGRRRVYKGVNEEEEGVVVVEEEDMCLVLCFELYYYITRPGGKRRVYSCSMIL
jgi:hypothetical protein